ncbi:MAG: glycosyltransferase [Planctomycetes bacterium]|nr:glycosyltransferase [Planctomycetota bacterium]
MTVDRGGLAALAKRLGLALEAGAGSVCPWSACQVVLGGTAAACEHTAVPDAPAEDLPGTLAAAAAGAGGGLPWAGLQSQHAAGQLPLPRCGACAFRLQAELPAPLLSGPGVPEGAGLVVVLRAGELPAAAQEFVRSHWPRIAKLVVEVPTGELSVLQNRLAAVVPPAALAVGGERPALSLRLGASPDSEGWREALAGWTVTAIELAAARAEPAGLARARTLATQLAAPLRARFVFTPETWYECEGVARACAAAEIPLELAVLARGGQEPLAALSLDDLTFVKDVLAGAWSRLGGSQRPVALAERAYDQLLAEVRAVLRREVQADLDTRRQAAPVSLCLPPPDHAWCADPEFAPWWQGHLFGHGHLPAVRAWLLQLVAKPAGREAVRKLPWLRTLVQRLACDQRVPELLELLRAVYGAPRARPRLIAEDQAFAAGFALQPYGGPWAERLGLHELPARKRPFAIGKPRAVRAGAPAAAVTVLIPSYRHAPYIEETLRSVLAQKFTDHRVLVVDDGSKDDTVAKAQGVADPRLTVRQNPTNLGLGNSVLQALDGIDTEFVALLNSDDLFHPDRLQRCLQVLRERPEVQLVTTGMALVDDQGGELTPANASLVLDGKLVYDWVHWFARVQPPADLPQDQLFAALLERNFLVTSSNLVVRTAWLRRQAPALQSLKFCLDWQLFLEAALDDALYHLPEPLLAYRLHATNTVWFREGRRWAYYLEVNRVAAEALRRFATRGRGAGEGAVVRVLEAIAAHLTANRETDGFALFLNTVFDALAVDRFAVESPRVQGLVQQLNELAEQVRRARDEAEAALAARGGGQLAKRLLLGELERERADGERDTRRWLQGYADSLEARLADCWAGRRDLEAQRGELARRADELQARVAQHAARIDALGREATAAQQRSAGLESDLAGLRQDHAGLRGQLAALRDFGQALERELAATRAERDDWSGRASAALGGRVAAEAQAAAAEARLAQTAQELARESATAAALGRELASARTLLEQVQADLAVQQQAFGRSREQCAEQGRELERLALRIADLEAAWRSERLVAASLGAQRDDLVVASSVLRAELAAARTAVANGLAAAEELREQLAATEARAREQLAAVASHSREQLAAAESRLREQLAATEARSREQLAAAESRSREQLAAVERRARDELAAADLRHQQALAAAAQASGELTNLRRSREFRAGNFLWNKMPLGYMSRRGKKWYHKLLDAKSRLGMVGGRLLRKRHRASGTAVVAACWQWPIYSHTFVYQEMIGLTQLGLDVRLFHWELGDTSQLHQAFGYLAEHRTQLQPVWDNHLKDREHFEKTKPGRLRAFLERISAATGKPVAELENDSLVLQGCTFARMAELAGASYLHSYFFYDQSFMAMQAAWLLDLPRGVSCYADHMLADYPFKLVPLHVELCSVIVATSARIKRELSQMTGGKYDAKIIVKPNGVDGARFPPVRRGARKAGEPFEVVSISRIEPKKGLIHLVEAVAQCKQRGQRVIAHIVGSKDPHSRGSLEFAEEFERRIAELGVQDQVILHGMKRQEELPPILQRCRAFVAPYVEMSSGDKDGIPTAMLEGLASGLPVVTTDSGSILEVVTDGIEGIVVPQRDSAAFAAALGRLIDDPQLELRMASAARARFDREFDIRVTERRLHERVAKLVARKPAGAGR